MIFIGNPTNNTACICQRSAITADAVQFRTVDLDQEHGLSAVIVDASAIAQRLKSAGDIHKTWSSTVKEAGLEPDLRPMFSSTKPSHGCFGTTYLSGT
jgi:hypothetical protein